MIKAAWELHKINVHVTAKVCTWQSRDQLHVQFYQIARAPPLDPQTSSYHSAMQTEPINSQ